MYFANGQNWGMPPYNWEAIAAQGYDYLIERLKYAENFYHLFRVDHFVGLFRIWTISRTQNDENSGVHSVFDPADEGSWEEHGKRLLDVMLKNTIMLPCAEDLGTVPDCSFKTIREYGIPGMDVLRWIRDWDHTYAFKDPSSFRPNAIATLATHDVTSLHAWWDYELGTIDELLFRNRCRERGFDVEALVTRLFKPAHFRRGRLRWRREIESQEVLLSILGRSEEEVRDIIGWYRETYDEAIYFWTWIGLEGRPPEFFDACLAEKILEQINRSASIFSVQLLQDWLSLSPAFTNRDTREFRINFPGKISSKNWSLVMPFSLEALLQNPDNRKIRAINERTGRIQKEKGTN
ncbi:4-alpha-glucanotransferase, partial [bacterium]|nr:4-alpha-glucanotransferase [bacterium]